jgi:GNAT superfamily N-acetyltransferase
MAMWVAPEARGTGAGDALVQAALAWSRDDGARTAIVWVYDTNPVAQRLYERNGFRLTGRVLPVDDEGRTGLELERDL